MNSTDTTTATAASVAGDPGFAIYIHWPFCLSKCPYCDFNSHVRNEGVDEARFLAAYRAELSHRAALTPGRRVRSIFFGGGTPSLMAPQTVEAILAEIAGKWALEPEVEISMEANPTSVEAGRFRAYRAAGVNRISIGVQALNDADLQALGRRHDVAEARAAVRTAAAIFPRYSFDLIYARPGQSVEAWKAELREAMAMAGDHLSLYQLTLEPDTMFEKLYEAGKLVLPDEDTGRALFDATQEIAQAHGLPAYEVSNHARPGGECRHNLVYWRYGEYVGIGPGAHGRVDIDGARRAQAAEKNPELWRAQVESEGHGFAENIELTREEQSDEYLLMGLRLREGIDAARYEALSGRPLRRQQIDDLASYGFIVEDSGGRLRVTPEGAPLLDAIVADLAA